MYTIEKRLLNKILKKQFRSVVGNSCEAVENMMRENLDKTVTEKLIKEAIKKYAYNSMREIEEQIDAFSQGVNININFEKPASQ